jgi:serine protease Do
MNLFSFKLGIMKSFQCYFILLFHALLFSGDAIAASLPTFADVAARTKTSVVNIRTNHSLPARRPRLDPYQFFLNETIPKSQATQSLGSGVIVSSDGLILTNFHVVAGATSIEVFFANQRHGAEASIVGTDPQTDLALLKTRLPKGIGAADLGDSDRLRVGDWVLAIGNPFGYEHTVTSGIISATGRVIGTGPHDNFLQTDAPINPGNSGGPLIDMRGRVIGINAAIDADAYGIGFATPINVAKKVMQDLRKSGVVQRPWFGAVCKNIMGEDDLSNSASGASGARVVIANLVVDSPAHRAGLKLGDLILRFEKDRVRNNLDLRKKLDSKKPEQVVKLQIYRRGKGLIDIPLKLGVIPRADDLPVDKDLL